MLCRSGAVGLVRKLSPVVSSAPVSCLHPSPPSMTQVYPTDFVKPNAVLARRKLLREQAVDPPSARDEHEAKRQKLAESGGRFSPSLSHSLSLSVSVSFSLSLSLSL